MDDRNLEMGERKLNMPRIEVDEGLEKQYLDAVRWAASSLRDRMDDLLRHLDRNPDWINPHGEIQSMGGQVEMACARYVLLRKLAREAGKAKDGEGRGTGHERTACRG